MSRSSERASDSAARPAAGDVPAVGTTLARLGAALAVAAGALLEHPDGSSPLPPLALFAVAVAIAIVTHDVGARRRPTT